MCELLDRTRLSTHAEARPAVFEFVEGWYNTRRRHSALGYLSPQCRPVKESSLGRFHVLEEVTPEHDRVALAELYRATGGPDWSNRANWLQAGPLEAWHGITTDETGRVTRIDLPGNQMGGELPAALRTLSRLESLDLSFNQLCGAIPADLGKLTRLKSVNLSFNRLSGEIPATFGGLTALVELYLNNNRLSGEIPATFGGLTALVELMLYQNELSGGIPAVLGGLTTLEGLNLGRNRLSGTVPSALGRLTRLRSLGFEWNRLSGGIPSALGNLTELESLGVGGNAGLRLPWTFPRASRFKMLTRGQHVSPLGWLATPLRLLWMNSWRRVRGERDRAVLQAFHKATHGPDWSRNDNWLSCRPLGEWYGVVTDAFGRVRGLELSSNQLTGRLPASLAKLTRLRLLDLNDNELSGEIPPCLGNLRELEGLCLARNRLSGEVPASLGHLRKLKVLALASNRLSGRVPASLRNVTSLTALWSDGNWFSNEPFVARLGAVAADRAALESLFWATNGPRWEKSDGWLSDKPVGEWHGVSTNNAGRVVGLSLTDEWLTGRIPASLGNLSELKSLTLSGNELGMEFLAALGSLRLEDVDLTSYPLSDEGGDVSSEADPMGAGEDRAALAAIYRATNGPEWLRSDNWLSDSPLGEWWGVKTNARGRVRSLILGLNGLRGQIPTDLGNLRELESLGLSGNSLTGEFPAYLRRLKRLRSLGLQLGGSVGSPAAEARERAALEALYQATNGPEWGWGDGDCWLSDKPLSEWRGVSTDDAGRVVALRLSGNRLNGAIPAKLVNLEELRFLEMEGCGDLSGGIPSELGSLARLIQLRLNGNRLSGAIPAELGNLANLLELRLDDNRLTGAVPGELGNLANLDELRLDGNRLTGAISAELGYLSSLRRLKLGSNNLSGEIPADLGNLSRLESLDLSGNDLDGEIPANLLGNLTRLKSLDLSGNRLRFSSHGRWLRIRSQWVRRWRDFGWLLVGLLALMVFCAGLLAGVLLYEWEVGLSLIGLSLVVLFLLRYSERYVEPDWEWVVSWWLGR